jgi:hypothetical protein
MKTMKQNTARNRAVTALLSTLFAALALAGCANLFEPINPRTDAGILSVSIAGQGAGTRTLYPNATFTKYELTFSEAGGASYGPKTITGKSSESFNDIPAGNWTITAVGYVSINGQEYAAAEGVSAPVTTASGQSASVSISISATQEGANGYFSYGVTFPIKKVDTATLTLSRFKGSSINDITTIGGPVDLKKSPSGSVDSGEPGSGLTPGYYRVDIVLENDYQQAGISEIVHIYSNMETKADYTYTEADFVDFITLSGTIGTITLNGASYSGEFEIQARINNSQGNDWLGGAWINDSGAWTISVPSTRLASTTSIRFLVGLDTGDSWLEWDIPGTRAYNGSSISGIDLGDINADFVALSGTIGTITLNDASYSGEFGVRACINNPVQGDDWLGSTWISDSGAWSIAVPLPRLESATSIRFQIEINTGDSWLEWDIPAADQSYNGSSIGNIALGNVNIAFVTLSGTIGNVTVEGSPYSGDIRIRAFNQDWNYLGETLYDGENSDWSIDIPALSSTTSVRFEAEIYTGGPRINWEIPAAERPYTGQNVSGIALGNVNFIILSGSIDAITVNGASPPSGDIRIEAFIPNGNWLSETRDFSQNSSWSIAVPSTRTGLVPGITIRFKLVIESGDSRLDWDIPAADQSYNGSSIGNIALGNVNIAFVTLSGTIGAVTVNSASPSGDMRIEASILNGDGLGGTRDFSQNSAWSMAVPTTGTGLVPGITIRFRLVIESGDSRLDWEIPAADQPYNGDNISNISLGSVGITAVTLSGTIGSVTVNGAAPSGDINVWARNQNGHVGESRQIDESGAWAITIPTTRLASTNSISFEIRIRTGGSELWWEIPEATRSYNGNNISNIALGNVNADFVTLSGTIGAVTVNNTSYSGEIEVRARTNNPIQSDDWLGNSAWISGNSAWSIAVPLERLASTTSVRFQLKIPTGDSELEWDIPTADQFYNGSSIDNIALGNVNIAFVTLSGTIGAVTVNGASYSDEMEIQARINNSQGDDWLGGTWINNSGAWSIAVPPERLASTTSIRFRVKVHTGGSDLEWDIPDVDETYNDGSISGINLGSVNINFVTLSGTIGAITVNGAPPPSGEIRIEAFIPNGSGLNGTRDFNQNGAWSMAVPTTGLVSGVTTIRFKLVIESDGSRLDWEIPVADQSYNGSSISNIVLGNVNADFVTLSGTIGSVTVNNAPYNDELRIRVFDQDNNHLRDTWGVYPSGSWTILIPSADLGSTNTLRFTAEVNGEQQNISGTYSYNGGDRSNIALGAVAITL